MTLPNDNHYGEQPYPQQAGSYDPAYGASQQSSYNSSYQQGGYPPQQGYQGAPQQYQQGYASVDTAAQAQKHKTLSLVFHDRWLAAGSPLPARTPVGSTGAGRRQPKGAGATHAVPLAA